MKYFITFFTSLSILALGSCSETDLVTADAEIVSYDLGTGIKTIGTFRASYIGGITTVQVTLKDQLPGSIKAVHMHDGNCESPGPHWNMDTELNYCEMVSMGSFWGKPYAGDVGNVLINSDGTGSFSISSDLWTVGTGLNTDLVGKLVIVHANASDFTLECDPNHMPDHTHPNVKIGCGTIE